MNKLDFFNMLAYKRPADSKTENNFIRDWIDIVPGMQSDQFGNRHIRIGDSRAMFSCHTDSVHSRAGKQKVFIDEYLKECFIGGKGKNNCLGADDAAGVFILLHMIEHNIPGLYVFHRAEEIGGIGSSHIASGYLNNNHDLLDNIDYCIAFDRKGTNSVITHQWARCCSDKFASALCGALGDTWKPDETGVFTDSANYTHIIPECTNLSVGYSMEHSKNERVNYHFVLELAETVLSIDWDSLPVDRAPGDDFDLYNKYAYEDTDYIPYTMDVELPDYFDTWYQAYDFVKEYPDLAADVLYQLAEKKRA